MAQWPGDNKCSRAYAQLIKITQILVHPGIIHGKSCGTVRIIPGETSFSQEAIMLVTAADGMCLQRNFPHRIPPVTVCETCNVTVFHQVCDVPLSRQFRHKARYTDPC
jgi:hypothetical protein